MRFLLHFLVVLALLRCFQLLLYSAQSRCRLVFRRTFVSSVLLYGDGPVSTCSGSLLFNPINAWLLYNYDFRVTFRLSAALIVVAGTLCCTTFTAADRSASVQLVQDDDDDDDEWSTDGQSSRHCTTNDVARRPEIALWYAGNCLSYLGFYMPFVNLVLAPVLPNVLL